jgi:hypothetical protein
MGTSAASSGPGNNTPLVPTWCVPDPDSDDSGDEADDGAKEAPEGEEKKDEGAVPAPIPIPAPPEPKRYAAPRSSFTSFAKSGDRNTLHRALSSYVQGASGGARSAAQRMSVPQRTASRILSFAQAAAAGGTSEALKRFGLSEHAGRPVDEVLPLLVDALCPDDGGNIDEGIARDALADAIVELSEQGLGEATEFTSDQLRELFVCFVANSIKDRVFNDVGINGIKLPDDIAAVQNIERTTLEVIRGCVHDSVGQQLSNLNGISNQQLQSITRQIYEAAYSLVAQLSEE